MYGIFVLFICFINYKFLFVSGLFSLIRCAYEFFFATEHCFIYVATLYGWNKNNDDRGRVHLTDESIDGRLKYRVYTGLL